MRIPLDPDRKLDEKAYDTTTEGTPRVVYDALDAIYGFTLDAAASESNRLCPKFYSESDSAFDHSWAGEHVFCNPPADETSRWVAKAIYETRRACKVVVFLLPIQGPHHAMVELHADRIMELPGKIIALADAEGKPRKCQIVVFDGAS